MISKSSRSVRGTHGPDFGTRKLLQHWTESSRIPTSRERSVWRKWMLKKKTAFSEEDRSLTCATILPGHWGQRFCRKLCRPFYNCSSKWWYWGVPRNSLIPSEGEFSKNYGADQQRLQISDLHVDKFPPPARFACWKIRFKTGVCTCSQFSTEAMLWIKVVEMVDSVDDLKSSCSVRGIRMPDFEVLDAKITSALNRIIHSTQFKRKVSLEEQKAQKVYRFLRGRQIAYLICEYFQVTGANDSVENYADLFTISLRNDDIQEFDSKWDGILLSMTKIPSDDILEGLYKLRIRVSEKLKTVLEVYNIEIHQKKAGPDYHRLKTMVKRSVEQNLRIKNFEARNGNYETSAVVKNPGTKQRGQRILGECYGQCSKGNNCSFRHDIKNRHSRILLRDLLRGRMRKMHREPEVLEAEAQVEDCLDCPARITSKELAPIHSVKSGILQNACSTSPKRVADLGNSALMHTARLMNSPAKGLKRRWQKSSSHVEEAWAAWSNGATRCKPWQKSR